MAAKRGLTSFNNSSGLKSAMIGKGLYPTYKSDDVLYDGSGNDIHLLHGQGDDGWFRTVNLINNATSFDFVDPNDQNLVRAWSVREIYVLVSQIEGVTSQTGFYNGTNWTCKIVRNGVTYSRNAANEQNAACLAFTDLVNDIQ